MVLRKLKHLLSIRICELNLYPPYTMKTVYTMNLNELPEPEELFEIELDTSDKATALTEMYAEYDEMLERLSISTEETDNAEKNAETFEACIPWELDPFDNIL